LVVIGQALKPTTAPQIAYDDAHLRVIFHPGHSDHLLVTFGDAENLADGIKFFADRIARKHNLPALGFMAKRANWYPAASIASAHRETAFTLRAFSTRLFYGSSMGGYAAIKYARLLGATHVISYCPQWSIDPQDCGENPSGFESWFTADMAGMAIGPADIAGSVNVFFDPGYSIDLFHARMIRRQSPSVRAWHVHYAGHNIAPVLRGAALTQAIWDAVRGGGEARIYSLINSVRRESAFRRQRLLEKAASRHPQMTARVVASLRTYGALNVVQPLSIQMRLCRALVQRADHESACEQLQPLAPLLSATRLRIIWYQLQLFQAGETALSGGLITAHATRLFYNAFLGLLFHAEAPRHVHDRLGIFPVEAADGGISCLAVKLGEAKLACILADDGHIDLAAAESCNTSALLRVSGSVSLTVTVGGRYLCAEPDGRVAYDRTQLGPWEEFR